jgi:hypothetical protein
MSQAQSVILPSGNTFVPRRPAGKIAAATLASCGSPFYSTTFNTASRCIASNGIIAASSVLRSTPAFRSAWMSR